MAMKIYFLLVQPKAATGELPLKLMFTSARELREAREALGRRGFRCSDRDEPTQVAHTAETAVECAISYFRR